MYFTIEFYYFLAAKNYNLTFLAHLIDLSSDVLLLSKVRFSVKFEKFVRPCGRPWEAVLPDWLRQIC